MQPFSDTHTKCAEHRSNVLCCAIGSILLEKLNRFHEEIAGTMPNGSIEKYELYMYIGALFNTAIMWIRNGAGESVRDIALMFCRTCRIPCD